MQAGTVQAVDFLGVNFPVFHIRPPTFTRRSPWAGIVPLGPERTYTHVHFDEITRFDAGLQGVKEASGWW